MSKLIDYNLNWFQEVAPRAFYNENDLERTVMLSLHHIFPEHIAVLFKAELVNNINGKKNKADLCMIKVDYTEWYVIEIELGKHSKTEVLNQIDTFRNCNYTLDNANYIYRQRRFAFDHARLIALVTTKPPELMVIVNEDKTDWKADLSRYNCKMCIFQIYNDFNGRKMYRLNGEHPFIYTAFCNCTYEKQVPYAVKILRSDFLDAYGINDGLTLSIEYNGINHVWVRQDVGRDVFLICNSPISPLDPLSSRYRLNYYKTRWYKPKSRIILMRLFSRWNKKKHTLINNSFSFTKD